MVSRIKTVHARQVYSDRGHPGIETTVVTDNGASGTAVVTAGVSVGKHEVVFVCDGGKRWGGLGVQKAVDNVNLVIAPKIKDMDVTRQREIDEVMLRLDGTQNKSKLGGNAIASVSAAVLKAASASSGLPFYKYIGGVNACVLPVVGVVCIVGSDRYGGGERSGGKPSYSFMAYGFKTFSEASYACWDVERQFSNFFKEKYGINKVLGVPAPFVPRGIVNSDSDLWDLMTDAIDGSGYKGKVGIQVDVAAGTYFESDKGKFVGLFSKEDKTREDLIELYKRMVKEYPFVIIEDPLDEVDYEGHAIITRELGIEVVGDDLFTTNIERFKRGIEAKACNAVLLKVNQIGTITEAFDLVQLAYRHGYGVMPCSSRGEGADIADYAVGLSTGHMREGGTGPTANRLLQIEEELGTTARFLGREGLKP